ncbi:RNase adapter RapZ [Rhizosaccharibacter radicis]|uniref:RNase adapter RapZ n=1 Tax=Rhizosaccharibacter radicis TaxID=2782605 RepID=A0ABT1VSW8_9PROT|nr:RNase adapter RapZ [Acetobacteraceae bacterium KSS12]
MTGRPDKRRSIVLVTGLSGAGKSSILRILEDLEHEAVDNPPLSMIEQLVARSDRALAIGVDVRTSGFDADGVLGAIERLRLNPDLLPELVYATADEAVLLRRFTATRRRHPLAMHGTVPQGIENETVVMAPLRRAADWVVDTTDLPPPELRRLVETRFAGQAGTAAPGLTVSLVSFAFPAGLPREADMVFDVRFLRNPFYDPTLSSSTGLDRPVADYVAADPDFEAFLDRTSALLRLVLPRFIGEGKKYATVAVGCSGGRHRSVSVVESLAKRLRPDEAGRDGAGNVSPGGGANSDEAGSKAADEGWSIIVTHRELSRLGRGAPAARAETAVVEPPATGASAPIAAGRENASL